MLVLSVLPLKYLGSVFFERKYLYSLKEINAVHLILLFSKDSLGGTNSSTVVFYAFLIEQEHEWSIKSL